MLFAFQKHGFGGLGVKHFISVSGALGLRLAGSTADFSMFFSLYFRLILRIWDIPNWVRAYIKLQVVSFGHNPYSLTLTNIYTLFHLHSSTIQNLLVAGLCPLSGIVKSRNNVLESGTVSVLR
jgi:hypothetical protein